MLASPAGFEPATHSLEGCCSSPTELRGRSTSLGAHLLRCARPASSTYRFVRLRRPAFARLAAEPRAKSHTPCRSQLEERTDWSGREDLNLRPPAPKAGALPDCATPRLWRDHFNYSRPFPSSPRRCEHK